VRNGTDLLKGRGPGGIPGAEKKPGGKRGKRGLKKKTINETLLGGTMGGGGEGDGKKKKKKKPQKNASEKNHSSGRPWHHDDE